MESANREEPSPAISPDAAEEMTKYGITRVPVDYFHCRDFRYTNLKDAIAQAKRQRPLKESTSAIDVESAEEMAKNGITPIPVDYFHYGDFRYTNLKDAVAQAIRSRHPD
jgi:hypothetical protein